MATSPNDIQAQELKLVTMTNLLNANMFSTFARTSPWNSQMIMTGEWTDGVGDSGRIATFGATDPRVEWMNINLASTSNQIPITVNDTGATEYSYSRFITRLSSQKLDVLRMRQSWQAKQQAENAVKQLVRAVGILGLASTVRATSTSPATNSSPRRRVLLVSMS